MKYTIKKSLVAFFLVSGFVANSYAGPRSKSLKPSDERPFFEQLREENNKKTSAQTKPKKDTKSSCGCGNKNNKSHR